MYITNSTYAYLSMRDGDGFAKRFGGVTGDDPDFFLLTIKAFSNGVLSVDSVNFYLADYRFSNNEEDYIIDEWTWVDLSSLGAADSLAFNLSSSDVGQFGINTPAYFCIDEVFSLDPMVSTTRLNAHNSIQIHPNPAVDVVYTNRLSSHPMECHILDNSGKLLIQKTIAPFNSEIKLHELPSGSYFIRLVNEDLYSIKKIIIE